MKRALTLSMVLILVVGGCAANKPRTLSGPEKIAEKKSIAENNPNNEWCWFYLGEAYDENGQYREAIQAYNQAAGKPRPLRHIDEWSLYAKMSLAYEELGEFDAAISAQKRSIELNPQRPGCFTVLSTLYVENKQYNDAIATAKQVLAAEPDNVLALNHLAVSYQAKKQYPEALKAAKRAIKVDPKQPLHYRALGRVLYDQNAYDEMAAAYKKGIEAAPVPDLYGGLATAYYAMGQYDAALFAVNQAIDLLTLTDGVGVSFFYNGDYPVITEVMSISPAKKAGLQVGDQVRRIGGYDIGKWGSEQDLLNIIKETDPAKVLFKVRRNGVEIETVFAKGKTMTPASAPWVALRSLIYRQKNDPARALADASMAVEIDPANEPGKMALGAANLDRGQHGEAVRLLQPLKENVSARLLEATAFAKLGKMKEAIDNYVAADAVSVSAKNIPMASDMKAMFTAFAPYVNARRDRAKALELKGQYKDALVELSEALKAAGGADAQLLLDGCFAIARKSPVSADVPEVARKHAIRSEVLVKDGKFEVAVSEMKKAIAIAPYVVQFYYNVALIQAEARQFCDAVRDMKTYLSAAPDSPHARAARDEIVKWEFMIEQGK